jgi:hypothetical protein
MQLSNKSSCQAKPTWLNIGVFHSPVGLSVDLHHVIHLVVQQPEGGIIRGGLSGAMVASHGRAWAADASAEAMDETMHIIKSDDGSAGASTCSMMVKTKAGPQHWVAGLGESQIIKHS